MTFCFMSATVVVIKLVNSDGLCSFFSLLTSTSLFFVFAYLCLFFNELKVKTKFTFTTGTK